MKFEIQALSRHGISFITEEYLPKKLKDRDWLE
jgi:DNA topoisomerase-6 subunit A